MEPEGVGRGTAGRGWGGSEGRIQKDGRSSLINLSLLSPLESSP